MIEHYNAFISYRHAELDSKIAEHVQRSLERFPIPDKIKKQTGKKRIQRVFRDKDELPITSNLSETISAALEDADFLIVICSHSTKESEWVRREIQYFLEHHSRDHVLTVLAEGDPYEVIPEELLSEERKYTDGNGVEHTVKVPLEPLSCDYRLPRRQADKEELPRLAAPIIGCSYDELMNRRRAYRIRRLLLTFALIFTVMLAFGANLFRSNMKINESYRQALKNQSLYLAHESQALFKEKHRTEAMLLALAALPGENNDRPVTAEAVRALTDATLAYKASSGFTVNPVCTYSLPSEVESFVLSQDAKYLAAFDSSGNIRVWETKTNKCLYTLACPSDKISNIFFYDDTLLLKGQFYVRALSSDTGEELWTYEATDTVFYEKTGILVSDSFILVSSSRNILFLIDPDTGELIAKHEPVPSTKNHSGFLTMSQFVLSPDEKKIAFSAIDDSLKDHYGYIDLETDEMHLKSAEESRVDSVGWYDNTLFLVSTIRSGQSEASTTGMGFTILNSIDMDISCCDIGKSTSEELFISWSCPYTSKGMVYKSIFLPLQVHDEIAFSRGNTCQTINMQTGTATHLYDAESSIVCMDDSEGNGDPLFIVSNGKIAYPVSVVGKDTLSVRTSLSDSICAAEVNKGIYAIDLKSNNNIIAYSANEYDDEFMPIEDEMYFQSPDDSLLADGILAVTIINPNAHRDLLIIDAKANELIAELILNEDLPSPTNTCHFGIAGIEDGIVYVSAATEAGTYLMEYSTKDGDLVDVIQLTEGYIRINHKIRLIDGKYVFLKNDSGKDYEIGIFDTKTGETEMFSISDANDNYLWNADYFQYIPKAEIIVISAFDMSFFFDLNTEKLIDLDLPDSWASTTSSAFTSSRETYALSDGGNIVIFGKIKDPVEIPCGGRNCIDLTFVRSGKQEVLLAIFDDDTMYRYDYTTGALLGVTSISIAQKSRLHQDYYMSNDGKELYILVRSDLSIIDLENWYETAVVSNCLGYCEKTDRFFAMSYISTSKTTIGSYKHYSVEDLIEKAKRLTANAELSDAQKSMYGIE